MSHAAGAREPAPPPPSRAARRDSPARPGKGGTSRPRGASNRGRFLWSRICRTRGSNSATEPDHRGTSPPPLPSPGSFIYIPSSLAANQEEGVTRLSQSGSGGGSIADSPASGSRHPRPRDAVLTRAHDSRLLTTPWDRPLAWPPRLRPGDWSVAAVGGAGKGAGPAGGRMPRGLLEGRGFRGAGFGRQLSTDSTLYHATPCTCQIALSRQPALTKVPIPEAR